MKHSLIDSHCHIDLYDNPLDVANTAEASDIFTVAVTYLPSHYILARQHLRAFKLVKPALGLHPLVAQQHTSELPEFRRLAPDADFIGEIGLDFSAAGRSTRSIQEESFAAVLATIQDRRRFVTLHSRGAESAVLEHLASVRSYPVVFHWFSGARRELFRLLDAGHFVSLNTKMISSQKWRDSIRALPKDRVLTETDGPFIRLKGGLATPSNVKDVVEWLATSWSVDPETARMQIARNFSCLLPEHASDHP